MGVIFACLGLLCLSPLGVILRYSKQSIGRYNPCLAACPPTPPTSHPPSLPHTHPPLQYMCNLQHHSSCEEVAPNPAVLATPVLELHSYRTLAKRLLQVYCKFRMATIQHERTMVASILKIGISQNTICDNLVSLPKSIFICFNKYIHIRIHNITM